MLSEERISIRVKFSKTGSLKFISHLDLARTMKSAFLRSKLPIWYTLGFNPHPKMVFSLPLSVGTASLCEFMDFYLTEKVDFGEICERLNKAFPADLRAIEAYSPSSRFCDIGWADYRIDLITPIASEELAVKIKALFEGDIIVSKTTKTGTREINIAPLSSLLSCEYKNGEIEIVSRLSCGENSFVNPKHIIEHISANIPSVLDGGDYTVCRENVWFADGLTEFK